MTCIERFETKTYTTHFDSLGNRISYKTDTSYAKDYWDNIMSMIIMELELRKK